MTLGWATVHDFSESHVLERLLDYERRIESSLYKAISELKKLQHLRESEQADAAEKEATIPKASGFEAATHHGQDARETQGRDALATEERSECAKQSQIVEEGTEWQRHTGAKQFKDNCVPLDLLPVRPFEKTNPIVGNMEIATALRASLENGFCGEQDKGL
ncbi:MAG: hypothetical protein A2Z25_04090 [Planctomycetes bacterium RBG_16_55_9]|nr:MAG: hypothetical protein A2Z25_04090 [Planctomycetes bacterium RBG_16_55_9]